MRLARLIPWLLLLVLVASISVWFATRERLPRELRIATAIEGGLYHEVGRLLGERIESATRAEVALVPTAGSLENLARLAAGEVHLAVLQASTIPSEGVSVLAPLYPEVVHVIVRDDSSIRGLAELAGKRVALGVPDSGMRESARIILDHYRIDAADLGANASYFTALEEDPTLDAAIVTTGMLNPDLRALLGTGRYRLLEIRDAEAISTLQPVFRPFALPRGLYCENPAVPEEARTTVACMSVLAARHDVEAPVIEAVFDALYETDLRLQIPTLVPREEVVARSPAPLHPTSRAILDPYAGLSVLTNFVEVLSGVKELLFGLAALLLLLWNLRSRRLEKQRSRLLAHSKEALDGFLERTIEVERAQMDAETHAELERHLADVTRIKIEALEELTHEDLRGDRMFQIFLMQCSNLSRKIQAKMQILGR